MKPPATHLAHDFSAEPVVGWRVWMVEENEGFRLCSVYRNLIWQPRVAFSATCTLPNLAVLDKQHAAPAPDCECGVYAAKEPMALLPYLRRGQWTTLGSCKLWGEVIESERAWRAATAYPKAASLIAPSTGSDAATAFERSQQIVDGLQADYGIPVSFVGRADDLLMLMSRPRENQTLT